MSQLVHTAEHGNITFPELTVSSAASHCSKQKVVDLDDLANLVGRDEGSLCSSSVNSNKDTLLELKSKSSGTLRKVSHLGGHLFQVSLKVDLILDCCQLEVEAIRSDFVRECLFSLVCLFGFCEALLGRNLRGENMHRGI